jgi:hypothetical protein
MINHHQINRCCISAQGGATVTSKAKASVLENTFGSAVSTPTESGVLSRPDFLGVSVRGCTCDFGRDGLVRKAGRTAEPVFSTSRPPVALENVACGFESRSGAKTMTKPTQASRCAVPSTTTMTPQARQRAAYALARQVPDLTFGFSIQTDHGPIHIPHGPTAKRIAALVEKMFQAQLASITKVTQEGGAA